MKYLRKKGSEYLQKLMSQPNYLHRKQVHFYNSCGTVNFNKIFVTWGITVFTVILAIHPMSWNFDLVCVALLEGRPWSVARFFLIFS